MYAEFLKRLKSKRKKAEKDGMPKEFLALTDHLFDRAIYHRMLPTTKGAAGNKGYNRSIGYLLQAEPVLDAWLHNIYEHCSNPFLNKAPVFYELKDKKKNLNHI